MKLCFKLLLIKVNIYICIVSYLIPLERQKRDEGSYLTDSGGPVAAGPLGPPVLPERSDARQFVLIRDGNNGIIHIIRLKRMYSISLNLFPFQDLNLRQC